MSYTREEVTALKLMAARVGMFSCGMHLFSGLILSNAHSLTPFAIGSLCGIVAGTAIMAILLAESLGDKK